MPTCIRAARNKNVIGSESLCLEDSSLTGRIDVINVVTQRVDRQIALNVVESRTRSGSALSHYWIADPAPGESVIIRTPHMNQGTHARIVV